VLAHEAVAQLGLERVLLVPVGVSPYTRLDPEPGAGLRLEMARLAAEADPLLEASDLETGREGPSFSFRTLELLSDLRPGDEFTFLMGADVAAGLEQWEGVDRVLELARLGIAARPGSALADAEDALERLGARQRATILDMPELGISSSAVRRRVAAGRPIRYLVPDAVDTLIAERGLYR
jgi:nicotinate-nucleotide adenylyltransferase